MISRFSDNKEEDKESIFQIKNISLSTIKANTLKSSVRKYLSGSKMFHDLN
jgi:hypothetical protein